MMMYFKNSVVGCVFMLIAITCLIKCQRSEAFGTFGFDIHHRYSDTVKEFLNVDGLPEKGSLDYYAAMAHRDYLFKARRLATTPLLTFFGGNQTFRLSSLGFPSTSSSSVPVPCNSTTCGRRRGCSLRLNACAYQEVYLSSNTSTAGILVDDVLHLGTDSTPQNIVEAPITLGVSVPSILASRGLAANSFSMCFGPDGLGRIEFGDKGSANQKSTPFNLEQLHPTYNVTVTQIAVENNVTDIEFTAVFDSGTSFTYLNDPAYTVIAESFNSQITNEPPYQPETQIIFDSCYALSASQDNYTVPKLNLTMRGGDQLYITAPTVVIPRQGGYAYCLAIVKSEDINIIGQNFMTGYRIVFDRDEMVLGWKESNCNDSILSNTLPVNKRNSTTNAPPPSQLDPEATPSNRTLRAPPPPPSSRPLFGSNDATRLNSMANRLRMVMFSIFFHNFFTHSF
ncbi:hypothetical protein BUALT_Bualt19G0059700 [Buddleja alternifolia]|uniref:Peptidase A1 domain-containing protein n=1 Tax=Buddleja alternifolia TaxID=168488 RepID=A0AAV6W928_9LAMI|nr:hypothetical protein BUALT_Bualt19G0059700 [Buddleja alternifolia]